MWPNGDFATPVGSFQEPVPVPGVDPLSGDCSIIRLNKAWLPYIRGALSQLWLETTWDTDAAGLINVQQQVTNLIFAFNDLEPGDCSPQPPPTAVAESDYEMSICEQLRFNNGVLEGLCCGVWTPIDGQTPGGSLGAPGQPGAGSGQPTPDGGQHEYCGDLGRGTWLLPTVVSTGDTLLFSDLFGAWQDSRDLFWHCPDGFLFVLDVCGPTTPHGSPDPVPTGYHMQLIAEINGTFYDILLTDSVGTPTVFTVPGGISNATVTIQANTDDVDLINGSVQFCVRVTNNQQANWWHQFNLLTNPNPFVGFDDTFLGEVYGIWANGAGFAALAFSSHGFGYRLDGLQWSGTAFNLDSIDIVYDLTTGTNDSAGNPGGGIGTNIGSQVAVPWSSWVSGTDLHLTGNTPQTGVNFFNCVIGVSNVNGGPPDGGVAHIKTVTITGHGPDPFA